MDTPEDITSSYDYIEAVMTVAL